MPGSDSGLFSFFFLGVEIFFFVEVNILGPVSSDIRSLLPMSMVFYPHIYSLCIPAAA